LVGKSSGATEEVKARGGGSCETLQLTACALLRSLPTDVEGLLLWCIVQVVLGWLMLLMLLMRLFVVVASLTVEWRWW